MKHIFVLNGKPRSGKDSFVNFCQEEAKDRVYIHSISSVDQIKDVAKQLGWNGEKDELGRNALSELKDLATKYWDSSFRFITNYISHIVEDEDIIFLMIREPSEIRKIVATYPQAITILLTKNSNIETTNHADSNVGNYNYDIVLRNNLDLNYLRERAKDFINHHINWNGYINYIKYLDEEYGTL